MASAGGLVMERVEKQPRVFPEGIERVRDQIDTIVAHYAEALGIPGHAIAYARAIIDPLWHAFPKSTRWHTPGYFAEIVAFHAMKAAGLPIDQATFRSVSVIGTHVMCERKWLLHYPRFLPSALRVASRDPGIEPYLARIADAELVTRARAVLAAHPDLLSRLRPATRAGVCLLVAARESPNADEIVLFALIKNAGSSLPSAYNAAKRLGLIPASKRVPLRASSDAIDINPSRECQPSNEK